MGATSKKILAKGLIYLRNVATHTGLRDTKMQGSSLVLLYFTRLRTTERRFRSKFSRSEIIVNTWVGLGQFDA